MNPFDGLPTQEEVEFEANCVQTLSGARGNVSNYLRQFAAILPYLQAATEKGTPLTDEAAVGFARLLVDKDRFAVTELIDANFARSLELANSAIRAATVEECAKYMDENGEEGWAYNLRALLTTKPPAPDKADEELRRLGYSL